MAVPIKFDGLVLDIMYLTMRDFIAYSIQRNPIAIEQVEPGIIVDVAIVHHITGGDQGLPVAAIQYYSPGAGIADAAGPDKKIGIIRRIRRRLGIRGAPVIQLVAGGNGNRAQVVERAMGNDRIPGRIQQ